MRVPSGDHCGADALLSPRVNCLGFSPVIATTQTWLTDFHSLSFSIFVSLTAYATREPSGEILGALTPFILIRSSAVRSFFPSFARGSGASVFVGFLSSGEADFS